MSYKISIHQFLQQRPAFWWETKRHLSLGDLETVLMPDGKHHQCVLALAQCVVSVGRPENLHQRGRP